MSTSRGLHHFLLLPADQQAQAIVRLSKAGWSEHSIASATRLNVEQIRRVLGQSATPSPGKCPRTGVPLQFCTCSDPHEGAA